MPLLDKMSIEELVSVRKMKRSEAEAFLTRFNLSASELSQARRLLGNFDPHHDNRLWLATGWLLGASFNQLARDKGVTKQSIMVSVEKMIPQETRAKDGRMGGTLTLEALSEFKVMFFSHLEMLRDFTPREAATWLMKNVQLDK